MKRVLLFLTFLLCLPLSVYADNEIVVKSVSPIYDEESSIEVSESEGSHKVVFNDKNQSVEYKVVIENVTDDDMNLNDIKLAVPSEQFLQYEVEGVEKGEVLKAKETKEFVINLSTVQMEGWGRNFSDKLVTTLYFEVEEVPVEITNPKTGVFDLTIISGVLIIGIGVATFLILKKVNGIRYFVIIGLLGTSLLVVDASDVISIDINLDVEYKSLNIMQIASGDYWTYKDKIKTYSISNEFSEITDYEYKFDVSINSDNRVIAYLVKNATDANFYDLYLQADGIIYPNKNSSSYFAYMTNLDSINNLEGWDTSYVENMNSMFLQTGLNSSVFKLDLGESFDTSSVTNMFGMFAHVGKNCPVFELDLGENFDTTNVKSMSVMFFESGYSSQSFVLDLGDKFNTENVESMYFTFGFAGYSSPVFTLDLGDKFDTTNVTTMAYMFNATGFSSQKFTLDLGDKFNTENVTSMYGMFASAGYASPIFKLDLGEKFDTGKVTAMDYMFNATGYNSKLMTLDLGDKFNTGNVLTMYGMFASAGYMSPVFRLDLGENFDTSKVTTMERMFNLTGYNSEVLKIDLGDKYNTGNVTNMSSMFTYCGYSSPVFTLDLGDKFDLTKVNDVQYMFHYTGYKSTNTNYKLVINLTNPNSYNYAYMFKDFNGKATINYTQNNEGIADVLDNYYYYSSYYNVSKGVCLDCTVE